MGANYLTWMADAFEGAGLSVVRYQGWTTRSRATGGFEPGRPLCVMWHHTASSTTPDNDAYYMCFTSSDNPITNLMIDRAGTVWCLAAGAANTNGKGSSIAFSRGTVPADKMNEYAVAIELCNAGTGEPFPQAQVDAAFVASNVLNAHLGNKPTDVCTHQAYAPTRKIDPARAESVMGPWQPRSINSSGSWDLGDLCDECFRRATPPLEDDMGAPSVITTDDGISRYFVVGSDTHVYQCWWQPETSNWSGWQDLEGQAKGSVSAFCKSGSPRIDLAVEGMDGAVWRNVWTGEGWLGWAPVNTIP